MTIHKSRNPNNNGPNRARASPHFPPLGQLGQNLWFQPQTLWGVRERENKGRRSSTLLCSKPCQITFDPSLLSHTFTMCCFPTTQKILAFVTAKEKHVKSQTLLIQEGHVIFLSYKSPDKQAHVKLHTDMLSQTITPPRNTTKPSVGCECISWGL